MKSAAYLLTVSCVVLTISGCSTGSVRHSASQIDFQLVDYHVHLKGGLTLDEAIAIAEANGTRFGIAENCGLGFPVTDDLGLYAYIKKLEGKPVYKGMQAEGREWVTLFSPEAIAQFDYVFTDAMTWTDDNGNRMRLWIPEEVKFDDKQVFMDMLVERIITLMDTEPIDIYVNPTFLPAVISEEYDVLWTERRMLKVIDAAVRNDVAIEINARYRIPSERFIRLAKKAGVKFACGTNNGGRDDLGNLEYCRDMILACDLTAAYMFTPKPPHKKPILTKGLPGR